jgi:hypothetical protein
MPAAPSGNEKKKPLQEDGCRRKANNKKGTGNSTGVVEEPMLHGYINIIH